VSGDGVLFSHRRTGEGSVPLFAVRRKGRKPQKAKFKWFAICHSFKLRNHLPFDFCHLPFDLLVLEKKFKIQMAKGKWQMWH